MNDNVGKFFERVKAAANVASGLASEAIEITGKKAEDFWNITKLAIDSATLQNEINDIYKELGRLVYQVHVNPGAQPEGVDEKLRLIDEKKKCLDEMEAQIEAKKTTRQCPNEKCGAKVEKSDGFCRHCGQKLTDVTEEPVCGCGTCGEDACGCETAGEDTCGCGDDA